MQNTKLFSCLIFSITFPSLFPAFARPVESTEIQATAPQVEEGRLADQVIIKRTHHGVPHIQAQNMRAAGFGLGYVQMEDYGKRVSDGLLRARGEWTKYHEIKDPKKLSRAIDKDAAQHRDYKRACATWALLDEDTRDMMSGFAAGVNYYLKNHPGKWAYPTAPSFTGYDVLARGIERPGYAAIRKFLNAIKKRDLHKNHNRQDLSLSDINATIWSRLSSTVKEPNPDVGSNAWAFAPERTTSGKAILVRNPHLYWTAGYYEAQLEVPGKLNFYGDFRIGGPLGTVCGFNQYLGYSTTNNYPQLNEIYAFRADPQKPDHYLLDGISIPIHKETETVTFKNGNGSGIAHREFLTTPYGPVIYRANGKVYVIHAANNGEFRSDEQILRMMKATNLSEWKEAMRMQAWTSSNFTYADVEGNIFYIWNAAIPQFKHKNGGDTVAIDVTRSSEIWNKIVPWDELPQLLNPKGGYLHNENDPFYFTNLNEVFKVKDFPGYPYYYPKPSFDLRSQLSYALIHESHKKLSLQEIINLKFNERMLLADRVKNDLVAAVMQTRPTGEVSRAIHLIKNWNNTVERDSRGSVLFVNWWNRYVKTADKETVASSPASVDFKATPEKLFKTVWSPDHPVSTPRGLANPQRAVASFKWAIRKTKEEYGKWDVKWGKVHRAIIGNKNVPIGGATGALGCFRVIWYKHMRMDNQNILKAMGGDGWVLAVEFDEVPRAYSVLAYGESDQSDSPYSNDQLEMFTNKKMKPVAYTEADIQKQLIKKYHPGAE